MKELFASDSFRTKTYDADLLVDWLRAASADGGGEEDVADAVTVVTKNAAAPARSSSSSSSSTKKGRTVLKIKLKDPDHMVEGVAGTAPLVVKLEGRGAQPGKMSSSSGGGGSSKRRSAGTRTSSDGTGNVAAKSTATKQPRGSKRASEHGHHGIGSSKSKRSNKDTTTTANAKAAATAVDVACSSSSTNGGSKAGSLLDMKAECGAVLQYIDGAELRKVCTLDVRAKKERSSNTRAFQRTICVIKKACCLSSLLRISPQCASAASWERTERVVCRTLFCANLTAGLKMFCFFSHLFFCFLLLSLSV